MSDKVVHYGLIWAGLSLALLWPALVNGGPIWAAESFAYLNGPKTALALLTGGGTLADFAAPAAIAGTDTQPIAGHSIYFGLVFFALIRLAGPWGPAVFQAGLFAAVLIVALRPFVVHRRRGTLFVGAAIAGLTAAPFFTAFLTPDFLAGLMIVSAIRLLGVPDRPGRLEALFFWCVTAFAALADSALAIVLAGLIVVAPLIFRLTGQDWGWARTRPLVLAIFLAGVGSMFFTAMVVETMGKPPLRPPYLSARFIADGPGYDLLKSDCAEGAYALCAYLPRLPASSNTILWERNPDRGVWAIAPPDQRRQISDQDLRFAGDVLAAFPLRQIAASLARAGDQLRWFGLEDFPYSTALVKLIDSWWGGDTLAETRSTALYRGYWSLWPADTLYKLAALMAAVHLIGLAWVRRLAGVELDETRRGLVLFALLAGLCLLGNAAVCGMIFAPSPRFQARVIWLLPMMSAIVLWRDLLWENTFLGYRRPHNDT